MRLDSYLVEIGNVGSRGRAKRAIIEGNVRVNDRIITKSSFNVAYSDKIEITQGMDKPAGYWKLKDIQEKTNIIKKGDNVLDVGSSAGGFLLYASELASHVHGIEFSREFRSGLGKIAHEHPNISIEFNDVFAMSHDSEKYDVLLFDITVNPLDSLKALGNVFPSLKRGGMLLQIFKLPEKNDIGPILERLSSMGFEIIQIIEAQKKESYVIARKI
ncbi:MAG: cell division protein FtsJ [Candidatus Methanoperedenaceae archaeon]|nr:MAG: cell division protein FtsJ [Candidatus Methanoperedenaceae archaeon]